MNSFLDDADEGKALQATCDKLSEWFFLGSPTRIMHLAELLVNASSVAKTDADKEDYRRLKRLTETFLSKVRGLSQTCTDVVSAIDLFESWLQEQTASTP
jgi:hypothetical protein